MKINKSALNQLSSEDFERVFEQSKENQFFCEDYALYGMEELLDRVAVGDDFVNFINSIQYNEEFDVMDKLVLDYGYMDFATSNNARDFFDDTDWENMLGKLSQTELKELNLPQEFFEKL